ncbi:lebercilin-like protein [Hippoglossus hippoglossus]|uniref:lebercilin-like protein n=1 Tax=Hippoglossus hippoglossus TaxID=8267 RepID=UPI00148E77CC|nr:lebercilin-like protein [Hippoglossus hippoglossus]
MANLWGIGVDTKTQGTVHSRSLKLPPNKPQQVSDYLVCISKLKNQETDLLQQLTEVRKENRQLKTLHYHTTVALQHYQEAQNSFPETITKHTNEVQALHALIHDTGACRNRNAAKLKATKDKLVETKDSLKNLKQVTQDHSLREREKLTCMLNEASAQLVEKDKRIQDMEKHIRLSQAWYNRQLASKQE